MMFARSMVRAIAMSAALALASAVALAQEAVSPEVETAARAVGKSLRCVVCQNQSIEDSGAPLAADMRQLVRERLAAGETPDEVRAFMTDRYGNFVLMKPPFQVDTLPLWLGPLVFAAIAVAGWLVYLRPTARGALVPPALSEAEEAQLADRASKESAP